MLYKFVLFLTGIIARILYNLKYEGVENLPKGVGYIIAGNHRSYFDPIVGAQKIPDDCYFMAKEELFKSKALGWIIPHLNSFPVSRGKGDTAALDTAQKLLDNGKVLMLFIEGTRSKDGKLGRPKSGTALLAAKTGVGVLPMSIDYGKKLGFREKIIIRYHPMISNDELGVDLEDRRSLRVASEKIMSVIRSGITKVPQEEVTHTED